MRRRSPSFCFVAGVIAALLGPTAIAGEAALSAAEAQQQIRSLLVPSPYRISSAARAGVIRYRIEQAPGTPIWTWPETAEQHVEREADTVVLTVCRTCGSESMPTNDALSRATAPTAWLESDRRSIVAFARAARGGNVDARMRRLVKAVQERLWPNVDYRGYRSALAAYEARGGDCTEFALLLAAAARADGIPTRVVAGLAYASRFVGKAHAFGPHMWVQAWDGKRWTSYDAGLGDFDAGHLALVIGEGNPDTLRDALSAIRRLHIAGAEGIVPPATETSSK